MDINKFGFYFLLGIILMIAFKFMSIIYVFFPAIATSCVLAYLFNPVYTFLYNRIHKRSISALIVIAVVVVIILIPIMIVAAAIQDQVQVIFREETIDALRNSLGKFEDFVLNRFGVRISEFYLTDLFPRLVSASQNAITFLAPRMIYNLTGFLLSMFISFFLMFYLLKNSKGIIVTFRNYFPLSYQNCDNLLDELGKETRSLILGHLFIAMIQGTFGAIGYWIFGIGGALLWGMVMMLFSFVPFLGTVIVWFPAVVYLAVNGEYFNAAGLFVWGTVVVGTSDNILRPKLTSALGTIHPVTVLLGVLIGLKEWGVIGLVIGPLIISVLLTLIRMFREEYLVE